MKKKFDVSIFSFYDENVQLFVYMVICNVPMFVIIVTEH